MVAIAAIAAVLVNRFIWLFVPSRRDDARSPADPMASVRLTRILVAREAAAIHPNLHNERPVVAVSRQLSGEVPGRRRPEESSVPVPLTRSPCGHLGTRANQAESE